MTTRYAILNPLTGGYEYVDNADNVNTKIAELAMALYLAHTHESPVSRIEKNEAGAETWYNENGDIINQSVISDEIITLAPGVTGVDGIVGE